MISVKISTENSSIVAVDVQGHSGHSKRGHDIVCAGVSSIVQSTLLGLLEVVKLPIDFERSDGLLRFTLPQNLNADQRQDADILLDTMVLSLRDFVGGYEKFIKLEVN